MAKRTVIVPVQFAVAVECEYTEEGTLTGTVSSFHPVSASTDENVRPGDEDAWDACLEVPPTQKDGSESEGWPDYLDAARRRLSMELGRPIFWDGENASGDDDDEAST